MNSQLGHSKQRSRNSEAGFTLLELLVVIAILGMLAVVAGPQMVKYLGRAKSDTAKLQIDQLEASLDLYRLDVGRYPNREEGLLSLVEAPPGAEGWYGPYLKNKKATIDPWGKPIEYVIPGQHGEYDIYSLGADKAKGGDGEDQDVVSW